MYKMNCSIIITLLFWLIELIIKIESIKTPIIQTSKGPVQGEILKTAINFIPYSSFKGIPYAEPPLKYARFKPPIEKKSWTNVLFAQIEGANCIQKDYVYSNEFTGSEDCLYLNVYTPKLQFADNTSNLLTVMVWIHGGAFKTGYGNSSFQGPDYIIEENVVLVTFNYRLGALGFLNLNHKNATGNAGLKDQVLVLRWVQKNIEKFGGNPTDVTIFGQSAGGVSVDLHIISDLSRGLFHRAISMSGSPLNPWGFQTPKSAVAEGFALGKKLGKVHISTDELLQTLYETSALEMTKKTNEIGLISQFPQFRPTIENAVVAQNQEKFLTECPHRKYLSNSSNKVSYLTGFAASETLYFAKIGEIILDIVNFIMNAVKSLGSIFLFWLPGAMKVLNILTQGVKYIANLIMRGVIKVTSDVLFVAGIDYTQKLMQHTGYPVYLYRFAYVSNESLHHQLNHINISGTAHADDLGYLFHMSLFKQSTDPKNPSFITRLRMVRLWTNFAKYGDPTPYGVRDALLQRITWPSADNDNSYLEFENNLFIKHNPVDIITRLVEVVNRVILPFQTGCVTD